MSFLEAASDPKLEKLGTVSDETIEIGTYVRFSPNIDRSRIVESVALHPEGIYMIELIERNVITNGIHVVGVHVPFGYYSEQKSYCCRMLFNEFIENFSPVTADDVQRDRAKHIESIELLMKNIESESAENVQDTTLMMTNTLHSNAAVVRDELSKIDNIRLLQDHREVVSASTTEIISSGAANSTSLTVLGNQKHLVAAMQKHAVALNEQYAKSANKMVAIRSESVHAMKSKADAMMENMSMINRKMDIIQSYLGQDVDIHMIRNGEVSATQSALHVFSQVVFMDEELVTFVAMGDLSKIDHNSYSQFLTLIALDDTIFSRLFTHERMVLGVQFTRNRKQYDNVATAFFNNQINQQSFLLIRDGDCVYAVHSRLNMLDRLFPTQSSMDNFFAGLKEDDLKLVHAQKRFAWYGEQFKNLSYLLQGIADGHIVNPKTQTTLLGPLPNHVAGKTFVEPYLSMQNMIFCNDEDLLIGDSESKREPEQVVRACMGDKWNAGPQDLVLFKVPYDIEYRECPSMYNQALTKTWDCVCDYEISLIKRRSDIDSVSITIGKYGRDYEKVTKKASMKLSAVEEFMNLSQLIPSVLFKLIQSRQLRPAIANKMGVFLKAAEFIREIRHMLSQLMENATINEDTAYRCLINYMTTKKNVTELTSLIHDIQQLDHSELSKAWSLFQKENQSEQQVALAYSHALYNELESVFGLYIQKGRLVCIVDSTKMFAKSSGMSFPVDNRACIFKLYVWKGEKSGYVFERLMSASEVSSLHLVRKISELEMVEIVDVEKVVGAMEEKKKHREAYETIADLYQQGMNSSNVHEKLASIVELSRFTASHIDENKISKKRDSSTYVDLPVFSYLERLYIDNYGNMRPVLIEISPVVAICKIYLTESSWTASSLAIIDQALHDIIDCKGAHHEFISVHIKRIKEPLFRTIEVNFRHNLRAGFYERAFYSNPDFHGFGYYSI